VSYWNLWNGDRNPIIGQLGSVEQLGRLRYPNLGDGSHLVLASDYSGEHAHPEFRVLAFLLTTFKSVMTDWQPSRQAVRRKHLTDGRRMSFKALNDARRINALPSFLEAASQLRGVLICVGVEKTHTLPFNHLPPLEHNWKPDSLKKLLEICAFGAAIVDGLRSTGQGMHWITDDDAIVATESAKRDAMKLFGSIAHKYPNEEPRFRLGIASQFDDDRIAEDLVAIPDLAAGAFSDMLLATGKSNIPTSGSGIGGEQLFLQIKSIFINFWLSQVQPLNYFHVLVRSAEQGHSRYSFGRPSIGVAEHDNVPEDHPAISSKWQRALEAHLRSQGIDATEVLKSAGIDIR